MKAPTRVPTPAYSSGECMGSLQGLASFWSLTRVEDTLPWECPCHGEKGIMELGTQRNSLNRSYQPNDGGWRTLDTWVRDPGNKGGTKEANLE